MRLVRYNLLWILLLSGCSKEERPKAIDRPAAVAVETVKRQRVPVYLETIGNVDAPTFVEIRPQVSGTLLASHVEPGQMVKKGDLLFTIDQKSYKAAYDKALAHLIKDRAAYEFAKKRVERFTDLVKKEFVSKLSFDEYQKEMETAKAEVLNCQAELSLAKIDLEHCLIFAPMDGRISNIPVDPGNLVMANHPVPLTILRQMSPLCVAFTIPQKDLQNMQRIKCATDLKMEVILPHEKGDAFQDDNYIGHLSFVDNHIDQRTGTILLKGIVDNQEHLLWPGEFVRIRMCIKELENALLVPESSVQQGQAGPFLYVVDNEMTAAQRPVILGERVGAAYVVEKGLEEGEQVVVSGHLNLKPGKKVLIKS